MKCFASDHKDEDDHDEQDTAPGSSMNDQQYVTGYFAGQLLELDTDEVPIKSGIAETDCTVLKVIVIDLSPHVDHIFLVGTLRVRLAGLYSQ